MRTLIIGKPRPEHLAMDEACRAALVEVEAAMKPGNNAGDVFDAHARAMDKHGMRQHRLNACGYSMGAKFTPSWMDFPMFYHDNSVVLQDGMAFFAHMILMNSDAQAAYCLGRTYIIGEKGPVPVSKRSLEMIRR
jgi:Xaa-Pro dipeptidase